MFGWWVSLGCLKHIWHLTLFLFSPPPAASPIGFSTDSVLKGAVSGICIQYNMAFISSVFHDSWQNGLLVDSDDWRNKMIKKLQRIGHYSHTSHCHCLLLEWLAHLDSVYWEHESPEVGSQGVCCDDDSAGIRKIFGRSQTDSISR